MRVRVRVHLGLHLFPGEALAEELDKVPLRVRVRVRFRVRVRVRVRVKVRVRVRVRVTLMKVPGGSRQ